MTLKIISGISGLTRTMNTRIHVSPTVTVPLYDNPKEQELFKEIILNFSFPSLENILKLFPKSDTSDIVIIVNHRTSRWVQNDPKYPYLLSFKKFSGLKTLLSNPCLHTIYHKDEYYVFKVADSKCISGSYP